MKKQTQLGKTDIYVNPIGLGTNAVGGHNLYPNLDEEAGKELVRAQSIMGLIFRYSFYLWTRAFRRISWGSDERNRKT